MKVALAIISSLLASYFGMTHSLSLDLTELRNKVSKIKVNPRGNLWATGHFMGKKSVLDSSFLESAFANEQFGETPRRMPVASPVGDALKAEKLFQDLNKNDLLARQRQRGIGL